MFRVGFNVGLRWKSDFVKKMGFKTVSCGSMTEDTAYNARDTSFSCDWLKTSSLMDLLLDYMIEQDEEKERINRQEKEQEKAKEKAKETKSVQNRLSRVRKEYKRIEAERDRREKAKV